MSFLILRKRLKIRRRGWETVIENEQATQWLKQKLQKDKNNGRINTQKTRDWGARTKYSLAMDYDL